jgi:putative ABC transport system permease protein
VVATLVLDQTSKTTVYRATAAQFQDADAVITATGDASLTSKLADQVAGLTGVRAVAADRSTDLQVKLPGSTGYRSGQLTGVATDRALQWQQLAAGRLPTADGEVAIGKERGVKLGSTVSLLVRPPSKADSTDSTADPVTRTAAVVGIVDLTGATGDAGPGSEQLFATQTQAADWGATDFDAIRVAAGTGVDSSALVSEIQSTLTRTDGTGLTVRTGAEETKLAVASYTRGAAALTDVLLVFATIAVLVCGLVIANTFAVLLAQRTKELALLRCVGASARQLRRGVLIESLIVGAVASAIGVLAGIGCAAALSVIVGQFDAPIPLAGVTVPGRAVLIGLAVGIVVTMVAAFLPARRATRVAPLAALRVQDPPPARSRSGLLRRVAGIVLLIPSGVVLGLGAVQGVLLLALAGGAVSFIAVLLLAQWLVPSAVALTGRLAGPSAGVPGRLAASNALRNPQRTAATATALIIGVTLTAAMVVGAASTRATASSGLDDAFPTDVVIQNSAQSPLPAGMDLAVTAVPNVRAALALPSAMVTGPGTDVKALGVDPARATGVVRSTLADVPKPGTVNVTQFVAQSWGGEGKQVRLSVGARSLTLRIHLVHSDTGATMTASDLAKLAPKAGIDTVWVRLADGLSADDRRTALDGITTAAADRAPASFVQGAFEQRDSFDRVVNTLLLIVTGLLAIAVVIAVIGVGNTMALSVLERRQESGLLRALGLTRGQLRWMLLCEAVLIAGVASILGTALGIGYGLLGTSAALSGQTGLRVAVPWLQLLVIVAVATGAGALASVLPSRRAARISPVAAIAA